MRERDEGQDGEMGDFLYRHEAADNDVDALEKELPNTIVLQKRV